jgi:hypothetical protein
MGGSNMSSNKQKRREKNIGLSVSREKAVPVAENSLQTKPPGAHQPGSANVQSASREELGAAIRNRPPLQPVPGGGERGGAGAQQTGWSSRQQAERIEARAEEVRLGEPQQSGYGGLQQDQHAGSQESPTGPPKEWQSRLSRSEQRQGGGPGAQSSSPGSKQSKRRGSGSKP